MKTNRGSGKYKYGERGMFVAEEREIE